MSQTATGGETCNACARTCPHYNICKSCETRINRLRVRCKEAVRQLDDLHEFVYGDLTERDRRLLDYFEPPQLIVEALEEGQQ